MTAPAHARPPKILVTKVGLDGHDRGSRIVAAFLRDAGMEVVYTGPWQEIPVIVKLALEEDVDIIGVSTLATDHRLVPKLIAALRDAGLAHIKVVVGGIVSRVFHPGAARHEIINEVTRLAAAARSMQSA
jgi:methylmalonyl-CoA mutase C-terminal domain/subunit